MPELPRLCEYAQTSFTVDVVAAITTAQSVGKMTTHRRTVATALVALAFAAFGSTSLCAQAAAPTGTPTGTWLNEDKDGIIEIGDCGVLAGGPPANALCGVVVWLKNPIDAATGKPQVDRNNVDLTKRGLPIMGMQVVAQMQPSNTPGRWDGRVYDLDTGKTYNGSLIVKSDTQLRVQGCQFLICQGEEWVRQAVPDNGKPPPAQARPANGRPASTPPAQPRAR